ncbi:MAG TPA: aspartate-semialdehyde dehydrogenase [Solirubrobacteraceae bacterium]|nr:aspartate-semialdehyde dehydrogenase [Solirubrobacteraceae bacterium]
MSAAGRVAVVGATGAVGRIMLEVLAVRGFPCSELVPFASERSAGRELPGVGTVQPLREDTIAGFDIALFSAGGATSREWAPQFAAAGAIVVDNSSAWRMDPAVPLVVSEVNPDALERIERGIVANPNCTTMTIMLPLKALHDRFGLREIVATSFQAAGGAGQKGIDELAAQMPLVHDARDQLISHGAAAIAAIEHSVHAAPLAYNVVPWLGSPAEGGYSDEELKLVNESRKILAIPELRVSPTCVRVPVMVGHSIELRATFEREPELGAATAALEAFPGIVLDDLPTPVRYAGRDEVAVGRIRRDLGDPLSLNLFVVGDNLLKGAALNAVQIAELLVARGLLARAVAARA